MKIRRRLRKPYNKLFRRDYFITEYMGAKFLLAPAGIGSLEISAGISERPELEHFMRQCRSFRPDLFLDIGMYSCILLKNDCVPRVILFEPDVRNQAHLGTNLLLNGLLGSVDVRPFAIGDVQGFFHLLPGEEDGGFSRIVPAPQPGSYEVAVTGETAGDQDRR